MFMQNLDDILSEYWDDMKADTNKLLTNKRVYRTCENPNQYERWNCEYHLRTDENYVCGCNDA